MALLTRCSLLRGPLCDWLGGASQMTHALPSCSHTRELRWKVLSSCHCQPFLPPADPCFQCLSIMSIWVLVADHSAAAETIPGCLAAQTVLQWVHTPGPYAPCSCSFLWPFTSRSLCLGSGLSPNHETVPVGLPLSYSMSTLSCRVWVSSRYSSSQLSRISITLKPYGWFYSDVNLALNMYFLISFLK